MSPSLNGSHFDASNCPCDCSRSTTATAIATTTAVPIALPISDRRFARGPGTS